MPVTCAAAGLGGDEGSAGQCRPRLLQTKVAGPALRAGGGVLFVEVEIFRIRPEAYANPP